MNRTRRLWLFRAGATAWEVDHRLRGRADLPLSPEGRAMVDADLNALAPCAATTVLHPDDEAARDTARMIVAALAVRDVAAKARVDAELAEPDLGVLEGVTRAELEERFPTRARQLDEDFGSLVPPEGEPTADAAARLRAAVTLRLRKARGRDLGLVLHPMALGIVRCTLAERPLSFIWASIDARPRIESYVLPDDTVARLEVEVGGE